MPKVKMLAPTPGSEDGVSINLYQAGQEYDLPEGLAKSFVEHMRVASYVRSRKAPPATEVAPSETAVEEVAPEVKEEPEPEEIEDDEGDEGDEDEDVGPESKSTRVYALAKELGTGWETVIKIANKLEIDVRTAAAGLTDSQVEKIKADYEK